MRKRTPTPKPPTWGSKPRAEGAKVRAQSSITIDTSDFAHLGIRSGQIIKLYSIPKGKLDPDMIIAVEDEAGVWIGFPHPLPDGYLRLNRPKARPLCFKLDAIEVLGQIL